jgi:hypothetical protein
LKLISRRDNGKNDQFCQLFQEFAHSLPGVEGGIVRMQFEFGIADFLTLELTGSIALKGFRQYSIEHQATRSGLIF